MNPIKAPKRPPRAAFTIFSTQRGKTLRQANPDNNSAELSRLLTVEWNALSTQQRRPFLEEETREREAYEQELQKYQVKPKASTFLFRRPPGRAKKGKSWDSTRGVWVASTAYTAKANSGATAKAPICFRRPQGRAKKGHAWDSARGVWEIVDTSGTTPAAQRSTKPPPSSTSKGKRKFPRPQGRPKKGHSWDSTRGIWVADRDTTETTNALSPPKSPPSAAKPIGRPKQGHTWDSIRGVWISDTSVSTTTRAIKASPTVVKHEKLLGRSKKGQRQDELKGARVPISIGRRSGTRVPIGIGRRSMNHASSTPTGESNARFIAPEQTPIQDVNGRFNRPIERPMKDCVWDAEKGMWRLEVASENAPDLPRFNATNKPVENSSTVSHPQAKPAPKSSPAIKIKQPPNKSSLKRLSDGTFQKPQGRPPKDRYWNSIKGTWDPFEENLQGSPIRSTKPPYRTSPRQNVVPSVSSPARSNAISLNGRRPKSVSKDDSVSSATPTTKRRRHSDGSFKRPKGRAPQGCIWNAVEGEWVSSAAHQAATNGLSFKRPRIGRSPDEPSASRKASKCTGKSSVEAKTPQNCLVKEKAARHHYPNTPSEQLEDGTFKKPVGRGRSGCVWDPAVGAWRETSHKSTSPKILSRSKRSREEMFKKPTGRPSKGRVWDGATGVCSVPDYTHESSLSTAFKSGMTQPKSERKSPFVATRELLPEFVPCGKCTNCCVMINCGSCLSCKNQGQDPSAPTCVTRMCVAPISRSALPSRCNPPAETAGRSLPMSSLDASPAVGSLVQDLVIIGDGVASLSGSSIKEDEMSDLVEKDEGVRPSGAHLARKVRAAERSEWNDDDDDDSSANGSM